MQKNILKWIGTTLFALSLSAGMVRAESQSVAGVWRYRLDPQKVGQKEGWFARELPAEASETSGTLNLPNTLDTAGISPNKEKPTLWRLYRSTKYVGPAWYERQIEIPANWQGKRITLFLERVHCNSQVWLDGRPLGYQDSLAVPHLYDLGAVTPGKHRLALCINNIATPDIGGSWAHSVGEDTQVNWNGVIGRVELQATEPVYLADAQVYPDLAAKRARVVVEIGNTTGQAGLGTLAWQTKDRRGEMPANWQSGGGRVEFTIDLGEKVALWDEFSPAMQELTVRLGKEERTVRFGMREFKAEGKQLVVNGRSVFLRGTLENCVFPLTGHPPMDVESWRRIFRVMKSYGLNFVRFHSWCPPEVAFVAADEEGIYLLPEAGAWYVGALPERDRWMEVEAMRILKAYGNHPSFCLFTLGNEMGGDMEWMGRIVERMIQSDPRRLYAGFSGFSQSVPISQNSKEQFRITDGFNRQGIRRLGDNPSTQDDFRAAVNMAPFPLVVHELGQAMVFPDVREIPKYTGVLKPKNLDMIRDQLERRGMLEQVADFVQATGKRSALQYKNVIEDELRTPGLGGFSLLSLGDYPGQGTSTIGMLNCFWDSKGIITPEAWREFCSDTVPLLRFSKRVYTTEETFTASAEVANYGPRDLSGITPKWSVRDEQGKEVASGLFAKVDIATGGLTALGKLELPLGKMAVPSTLTVAVALEGTPYVNRWDIHVYPSASAPKPPEEVLVANEWGPQAKAALAAGRKVFLQIRPEIYENCFRGQWQAPFWSSVAWGTKNELAGGLFDAKHPALAQFPTPMYHDFRWHDMVSWSVSLDAAPPSYRPIGQMIDNHGQNRKIGVLFEARVGPGRLLACGFNVWDNYCLKNPEVRQLARSLYAYMGSEAFAPRQTLDEATLDQIFRKLVEGSSGRLGVQLSYVENEAQGYPAANLLDGNPKTFWRSADAVNAPVYPKEIILELPKKTTLRGVKLVAAWGGRVKGYAIYTREDNSSAEREKIDWIQAARGECNRQDASETILFAAPRLARAVKLVLVSGFDPNTPYASLAEVELLPVEK